MLTMEHFGRTRSAYQLFVEFALNMRLKFDTESTGTGNDVWPEFSIMGVVLPTDETLYENVSCVVRRYP